MGAFIKYVIISEKAQKNFGEYTHTIGNTISTKILTPSPSGSNGMKYSKALTWDVRRVLRWYAFIMSILGNYTGPAAGYASQIEWRMWGKARPNCINAGATSLSVVPLKLRVP